MMDSDVPRIDSPIGIWPLRCRRCAAHYLVYSLLDSRRGNTISLYRCAGCGDLVWDKGAEPARQRAIGSGD